MFNFMVMLFQIYIWPPVDGIWRHTLVDIQNYYLVEYANRKNDYARCVVHVPEQIWSYELAQFMITLYFANEI